MEYKQIDKIPYRELPGILNNPLRNHINQSIQIQIHQRIQTDNLLLVGEEEGDENAEQPAQCEDQPIATFATWFEDDLLVLDFILVIVVHLCLDGGGGGGSVVVPVVVLLGQATAEHYLVTIMRERGTWNRLRRIGPWERKTMNRKDTEKEKKDSQDRKKPKPRIEEGTGWTRR